MENFEKRHRAYEAKFARDHELQFKVDSKAFSILAQWIATEKLNLDEASALNYKMSLIGKAVANNEPEHILSLIKSELDKARVEITEDELDLQLAIAAQQAHKTIAELH